MAQPHITDTEILTEHLGYAPVSLLDSIINVVNSLADRTLDRVEQGLTGASAKTLGFEKALKKQQQQQKQNPSADPPRTADEAAKFEVADGVHKLETLLCNAIDKNFDIFELYVMRYLICLSPDARPWLRLSHYGPHDFDAPARDGAPTPESVNAVRRSLQGSQRLNVMLRAEKARNAALLAKLRAAVAGSAAATGGRQARAALGAGEHAVKAEEDAAAPFGFLHAKGGLQDADARTPISTTTAFTLSQLQALRALSTSLTNLMPDLAGRSDENGDDDRRKGWRRERVEYVEVATRKHLENVRGLELGENGEVRDGEWQGEGKKLAEGEVEGLENMAAALGGGSGEASSRKEDEMDES
ncbi:Kinetochore-associated protein MTW1 like [Verticillium longisporum]|nr:Kinetochore-associated protein MTW1 like [Verticillium longisporum]